MTDYVMVNKDCITHFFYFGADIIFGADIYIVVKVTNKRSGAYTCYISAVFSSTGLDEMACWIAFVLPRFYKEVIYMYA